MRQLWALQLGDPQLWVPPSFPTSDYSERAIGIGDRSSGQQFCDYTQFPADRLFVDPEATVHQTFGLYLCAIQPKRVTLGAYMITNHQNPQKNNLASRRDSQTQ